MKKINDRTFFRFFAAAALLSVSALLNFSCSKDDGPEIPPPADPVVVTYVLSQGNMGSGVGVLGLIDENGVYNDSIFARANPGHKLGNVAEGLDFYGDNIYVISQNGNVNGGDGILVVADVKTMKLKTAYTKAEFTGISLPTHLVVVNADKAYVRGSGGLFVYDLHGRASKGKIDGTNGAIEGRMVRKGAKIFVGAGSNLLVVDTSTDKVDATLPMGGSMHNVIEGPDGNIWVCAGANLLKINPATNEVSEPYALGVSVTGWPGVGLCVTPSGDTFFFSSGTNVYKYKPGAAKAELFFKTEDRITDGGTIYGQLGINPGTGLLYVPTIKSYADFKVNAVSLFRTDVAGDPVKTYNDMTPFANGFWFRTK